MEKDKKTSRVKKKLKEKKDLENLEQATSGKMRA